jgi:hypothetical protein
MSKTIQNGIISSKNEARYPKGFRNKASLKLLFDIKTTERVVPQEGQGIEVSFLNKQTVTDEFSLELFDKL